MRVAVLKGPLMLDAEHDRLVTASREDRASAPYLQMPPANIGDWFVTRVTTETLAASAYYTIGMDADDRVFDACNEECDVLILKGGNFIHRGWIEKHLPLDRLKKIKLPIVYIGAGLQSPFGSHDLNLTEGDIASLKYIHESCHSCMVRGFSTAEALAQVGIRNVRVAGCPTLFWSRQPTISIRRPAFENVGWTMRNTLFTDRADMHKAQFDAIRKLRDQVVNLTVILQGEEINLQRYFMLRRWGAASYRHVERRAGMSLAVSTRTPVDRTELAADIQKQYGAHADAGLLAWVRNHTFFSFDVAEYVKNAKAMDFVTGCRLHGNVVALANGTPVFYFTYDERTRELVDLWKIPNQPLAENATSIPLDSLDYAPFEAAYRELYAEYRTFLGENGIAHTLH